MDEPRDDLIGFGNLDGEIPLAGTIRISGQGWADRGLYRGEKVALALTGEVVGVAFKKVDGVLTRIHTVKIDSLAEPIDMLADQVVDFLSQVEDSRKGRAKLPLEEGDTAGEEE